MSNVPLMPMATAVWLVENTTLTFKQIADFCNLHEVEIQGIADGEVAKGIIAYNPIIAGQLTKEEIDLSSKDHNRPISINKNTVEISDNKTKFKTLGVTVTNMHVLYYDTYKRLLNKFIHLSLCMKSCHGLNHFRNNS